MLKLSIQTLLLVTLFTFTSCSNDDDTNSSSGTVMSLPGERGEYFIEAEVDGVKRRADYTPCKGEECLKNHGHYSPRSGFSNFVREFFPPEYEGKIYVFFHEYNLATSSFPDTLPYGNSFADGKLEFDYLEKLNDTFKRYVNVGEDFELVITSFENDTLIGTFGGKLTNYDDTSDTKMVANGKFKVLMYNTDN